jgi:hypothetical protein
MATTARRRGEMERAEFLDNAKRGILKDNLDAFVPLDLFGPPTEAELAEASLEETAATAVRHGVNGHVEVSTHSNESRHRR